MYYFKIKKFSEDRKERRGLLRNILDSVGSVKENNSCNYKSRKWGKAIKDWNKTNIVKAIDNNLEEDLL
jgi:hypothetical protein